MKIEIDYEKILASAKAAVEIPEDCPESIKGSIKEIINISATIVCGAIESYHEQLEQAKEQT